MLYAYIYYSGTKEKGNFKKIKLKTQKSNTGKIIKIYTDRFYNKIRIYKENIHNPLFIYG